MIADLPPSHSPIWISPYRLKSRTRLNAASSRQEFSGALIRIGSGFGCLHPWPELGDPPLKKCLEDLAGARRWSVVRRALRCVEMDGAAREHEESLFDEMEVPRSHATLPTMKAEDVEQAVHAGFSHIKLKANRNLDALGQFLRQQVAVFPKLMWRLDFNETSEAALLIEWLLGLPDEVRKRIDFLEDPCPYSESTWTQIKRATGVRLAVDREAAPNCEAAQLLVLKPAIDEPWLLAEAAASRGRPLVVTSYMDHPLGQCFAAWEAARIGLSFRGTVTLSGLQTHHLFEPDAFSECLGPWSPEFQAPGGTGLGFDDLLNALVWTRLD